MLAVKGITRLNNKKRRTKEDFFQPSESFFSVSVEMLFQLLFRQDSQVVS